MRADVKLGMAISAVVVLVAGGYFTFRDRPDNTLPLAGVLAAPAGTASKPMPQRTESALNNPQPHKASSNQPPSRGQRAVRPHGRTAPKKAAHGSVGTTAGAAKKAANSGKTKEHKKATATPRAGGKRRAAAASKQRGAHREAGTRALGSAQGGKSTRRKPPAATPPVAKPPTASPTLATPRPKSEQPAVQQKTPSKSTKTRSPKTRSPQSTSRGGARTLPKTPVQTRVDPGVAVDIHHVRAGETFTSLALMYYGSVKHTRFLVGANPQIPDPDRLSIGATVKIPPLPPPGTLSPARSTGHLAKHTRPGKQRGGGVARTHTVQSGDTFYDIARNVLGNAARWKELFELNRELVGGDPKQLQVGTVLKLPKP